MVEAQGCRRTLAEAARVAWREAAEKGGQGGKESLDVGIKRASVLNVNLLVGHVVVIGSISAGL